jgi:hypothetical protein
MPKEKPLRVIREEQINKSGTWAFFDGESQEDPFVYGVSEVLNLFYDHFLKFNIGLGGGTNNYVKLMALKLLIMLTTKKIFIIFEYSSI